MVNQKYEITDIAHEMYPFLQRIWALWDIGADMKTGDLGSFIKHESKLPFKPGNNTWIFDDAIRYNFFSQRFILWSLKDMYKCEFSTIEKHLKPSLAFPSFKRESKAFLTFV